MKRIVVLMITLLSGAFAVFGQEQNIRIGTGGGGGGGAVNSVNGQSGTVNLTAGDVGASASSHTHIESDVTSLAGDLSAKSGTNETRSLIHTNAANKLGGDGALMTGIPETAVSSLVADLGGKAAVGHTHAGSDITLGTVALARGGTGASLSDPNANVIYGWDDTDNAFTAFTIGSGFTYTHATHTLSAPGGGGGDALTSNPLSQFAPTTSAQLAGVLTDETGSGLAVFGTAPTLTGAIVANGLNGGQSPGTNFNLITVSNGTLTAASLQGGSNVWSVFGYGGTNLAHVTTNHVYLRDLNLEGTGAGGLTFSDSDNTQTGTITAPADFTANRTFTLPDASGTFALTANNLSVFGATTSAQLAGVLTDETGSGLAVFATSPTLTTPTLGVATATSVNKWTLTAPTTAATLTAGADNLTYTGPSTSQTLVGRTSTDTLQNKTIQSTSAGGNNTVKLKGYLQLKNFDNITGAKPNNTNDYTASTFMKPVFLNGTAATANFIQFQIQVPTDFDTSVDPKIRITDKLTAGDTGVRRYIVSTISPAASAAYDGTVGTAINVDMAADASGASGDVEQSSQVPLTGWGAALTAGRHWVIQIGRDGNSGTDTSTVDSMFSVAEIEYGITQ